MYQNTCARKNYCTTTLFTFSKLFSYEKAALKFQMSLCQSVTKREVTGDVHFTNCWAAHKNLRMIVVTSENLSGHMASLSFIFISIKVNNIYICMYLVCIFQLNIYWTVSQRLKFVQLLCFCLAQLNNLFDWGTLGKNKLTVKKEKMLVYSHLILGDQF